MVFILLVQIKIATMMIIIFLIFKYIEELFGNIYINNMTLEEKAAGIKMML